jgi:hypothetical protein
MAISGHKTRAVFERYNIVSDRDLLDSARKLKGYLAAEQKANRKKLRRLGADSGQTVPLRGEAPAPKISVIH